MARTQKQTPQQMAQMRDWKREVHSSLISERFPDITLIEVKAHYTPELSWHGKPGDWNRAFKPSDKAYFKSRCPWRDCVAGGLDLDSQIRSMIDEHAYEKSGHDCCRGWQDESRIGRHECMLGWDYTISITYRQV